MSHTLEGKDCEERQQRARADTAGYTPLSLSLFLSFALLDLSLSLSLSCPCSAPSRLPLSLLSRSLARPFVPETVVHGVGQDVGAVRALGEAGDGVGVAAQLHRHFVLAEVPRLWCQVRTETEKEKLGQSRRKKAGGQARRTQGAEREGAKQTK